MRKDAVQDMVRAIEALNALMQDPADVLRFTVGRIVVEPNSSNSVAGKVTFSIDLRHPSRGLLNSRGNLIAGVIGTAVRSTKVDLRESFNVPPTEFDESVVDTIERAAAAVGAKSMRLLSGAFHDAQFVAPVAPTGMIFVPCRKGISHNPAEYAEPAWLAAGTRVLTEALVALAA
jgi:beta-ureidopropionase / N-carbamoyl-L-amino-acid hydrolase